MLIRLISLVILFIITNVYHTSFADNNSFIYPKKKPPLSLKKSEVKNENDIKILLPSSKPIKKQNFSIKGKSFIIPKEKPSKTKKIVENKKKKVPEKTIKKEKVVYQIIINNI